jgi:hypothetical protein
MFEKVTYSYTYIHDNTRHHIEPNVTNRTMAVGYWKQVRSCVMDFKMLFPVVRQCM